MGGRRFLFPVFGVGGKRTGVVHFCRRSVLDCLFVSTDEIIDCDVDDVGIDCVTEAALCSVERLLTESLLDFYLLLSILSFQN
mgnify:FL=1